MLSTLAVAMEAVEPTENAIVMKIIMEINVNVNPRPSTPVINNDLYVLLVFKAFQYFFLSLNSSL